MRGAERVTPPDEQVLGGRNMIDEGVQAHRFDAAGNRPTWRLTPRPSCKGNLLAVRLSRCDLAEDPGQLAAIDQDVIRPLEACGHSMVRRQHVDECQPGGEGDSRSH